MKLPDVNRYLPLLILSVFRASGQETPVVPDFSNWIQASAAGPNLRLTFSALLPAYPLVPAIIDGSTAEYRTLSLIIKLWVLPQSISDNTDITVVYRYLPKDLGKGVKFFIDLTFSKEPKEVELYTYIAEFGQILMTEGIKIPTPIFGIKSNISDLYYDVTQPFSSSNMGGPYDASDPCSVFTNLDFCSINSECIVPPGNNTIPYCSCLPNYGGEDCNDQTITPLIAGAIAIGAFLGLALLILIVFCILKPTCKCRCKDENRPQKQRKHRRHRDSHRDDDDHEPYRPRHSRDTSHRFWEPVALPSHTLPSHANHWGRRGSDSTFYSHHDDGMTESELEPNVHKFRKPSAFPSGAFVFYPYPMDVSMTRPKRSRRNHDNRDSRQSRRSISPDRRQPSRRDSPDRHHPSRNSSPDRR